MEEQRFQVLPRAQPLPKELPPAAIPLTLLKRVGTAGVEQGTPALHVPATSCTGINLTAHSQTADLVLAAFDPPTLGSVPDFSQPDFTGQQPLITRACPHPSHQMIRRFMKISLTIIPQLGSPAGTAPLQLLLCCGLSQRSALASSTTGPQDQACRYPGQELQQAFRVRRWH